MDYFFLKNRFLDFETEDEVQKIIDNKSDSTFNGSSLRLFLGGNNNRTNGSSSGG